MAESTPNQNFVVMSLLVWIGKVFLSKASYFSIHYIKFLLKEKFEEEITWKMVEFSFQMLVPESKMIYRY